jgi:hypothetical protein
MLELLQVCWNLVVDLTHVAWDLVSAMVVFLSELLYHLHVSSPRLEGLLVGVGLAWLLSRRDRHPLLKVLSSPLKLVLDVADLVWDQCVEVLKDLWSVAKSWVRRGLSLCVDLLKSVWSKGVGVLVGLKDRLLKSKGE